MKRPVYRTSSEAFTLVELLVVIGIIAVLISILLPALNKARQQSVAVQCASNLRQIGLLLQMYANDNNGYYPNSSWENGNELFTQSQIGTDLQHLGYPERFGLLLGDWNQPPMITQQVGIYIGNPPQTYISSRNFLSCPGLGPTSDVMLTTSDANYNFSRFSGYSYCVPKSSGYNDSGAAPNTWAWRPKQYIPIKKNIFKATFANDLFSANNVQWKVIAACMMEGSYETEASGGGPGEPIWSKPHNDQGVNVLYFDGSARWIPKPTAPLGAGLGAGWKELDGTTIIPASVDKSWPDQPGYGTPAPVSGDMFDYDVFWLYANQLYGIN